MSVRKPATIRKSISQNEADSKKLESKRDEVESKLDDLQNDVNALLDDESNEAADLNTRLQAITGGIENRKKKIEALQEELAESEKQERRDKAFQQCISEAKKANRANDKYIDLLEDLDSELVGKIAAIFEARTARNGASKAFYRNLEVLEPAAKKKHSDAAKNDFSTSVQEVISAIEDEGVDTTVARSRDIINERFYRGTTGYMEKATVNNFGHWIYKMLNKHLQRLANK